MNFMIVFSSALAFSGSFLMNSMVFVKNGLPLAAMCLIFSWKGSSMGSLLSLPSLRSLISSSGRSFVSNSFFLTLASMFVSMLVPTVDRMAYFCFGCIVLLCLLGL